MPDQVDSANEQPAERPVGLTAAQALQFIKDNFVLVSAAALLIGVTLATTFLAAYLYVFDWHLLWFVQYTDIITFGLIAVGIVSGSLAFLQSSTLTVLETIGMKGRSRIFWVIAIVVLVIALTASNVHDATERNVGYRHIISGTLAFFGAIFLIVIVARFAEKGSLPSSRKLVFLVLALIGEVVIVGQWLGEAVKETADFNQDVALKDQTLSNVKLVIVMSRHTVLIKDKVLYVVPTGDILKFQTANKNAKPKSIPEE